MKNKNLSKKLIRVLPFIIAGFILIPVSFCLASACYDECAYTGQQEILGNSYKTCGNHDSDYCLEWSSWQNNTPTPTPLCYDECAYTGLKECASISGYKVCGNHDSDYCLEWSAVYTCGSNTCSNGECVSPIIPISYYTTHYTKKCYNNDVYWYDSNNTLNDFYEDCGTNVSTGNLRCSGNIVQREMLNKGCSSGSCYSNSAWENYQDCSALGKVCQNGSCINVINDTTNHSPYANAGSDKDIYRNNNVILDGYGTDPDGDSLTYSWHCNGGSLSNSNSADPVYYPPSNYQNMNYVCTLVVTDSHGLSASDQVNILVRNDETNLNLSVGLTANPSSSCYSLNNVNLTASVSGSATGQIVYYFDCTNNGSWEKTITDNSSSYTAYNLCNYSSPGIYTAKVRVDRQGLSSENTTQINTSYCTNNNLTVDNLVRNISDGTSLADSVSADPNDAVLFSIQVTAGNYSTPEVFVKDILPENIKVKSNSLKVDGNSVTGDIISGLNIGRFSANQSKTITFEADISSSDKFEFGENQMINSALAYTSQTSNSDSAKVIVNKKSVLGAATGISTGLTNNIFLDSFLLPLMVALLAVWLFRSRIVFLQKWLDSRKKKYREYQTDKMLKLKIGQIKFREWFKKIAH